MSLGNFFTRLKAEIQLIFGKLPSNWEDVVGSVVNGLEKAKSFLQSPTAATVENLFPNGIGTTVGNELLNLINNTLPELEIAKDCGAAIQGITDPTQKANVIIQTILTDMSKLPADWQGKHWEDIAQKILVALLGITTTEANSLVNLKYGEITTK